jgi:hypothetical protein
VEGDDGWQVRLLEYIPGRVMADYRPFSPELLRDLGGALARLDRTLADYEAPAFGREFFWDLALAGDVVDQTLAAIENEEQRSIVEFFRGRFSAEVVPELGGLVARLEELEVRLVAGLARGLALARERVRALGLVHPGERLAAVRQRRLELEERLHRAILVALALPRSELASLGGRLHALSPLAVLGRGYALARLEGVLVTDVDSLTKGDRLVLRFARGSAAVVVEETYSNGGTS